MNTLGNRRVCHRPYLLAMPAPDLPPPPADTATNRPLAVHLHTRWADPESLRGGVVIVIDALRASVTITAAIHHGAACVVPTLTVEDATAAKAKMIADPGSRSSPQLQRGGILLGGERGGVLVRGFDLDNSPLKYTREVVAGKTIVFTTSNGTATLLHARHARLILVGSFANLSAVCSAVADRPEPVHIISAGTRDEISMDDILPAGAMVERLVRAGRQIVSDDSARVALACFQNAVSSSGGLLGAMRASRGGRGLEKLGLGADLEFCSRIDTLPTVPVFDPGSGFITRLA